MILIAGGSGFMGINTARCLVEKGEVVLMVQRHTMEPPPFLVPFWGKQIKQALGDILDLPFVLGLIKDYKIDSIIHCAHETPGSAPIGLHTGPGITAPLHQMLNTQITGMMNCLEAARIMELRRVTVASSIAVYMYGSKSPNQINHEDDDLPGVSVNEVGNSKKAMEQIGLIYANAYGISFASLRIGGNYGPACRPFPFNIMITNALEGQPTELPIFPSDSRTNPIYARDTAEATCTVHLAKSLKHYIYNVTEGTNPTWQEVADTVKEILPKADIKFGPPANAKIPLPPQSMARMKEEFGFVPHPLRQGIERFVKYLQRGEY